VGGGSCNLSFKLLFETGCAGVSVTAEWQHNTVGMLRIFLKTDNPFVPVSH